ncbi:MAG: hypothetical protein HQ534_10730 [Armatimonadetes bacterium]|nr:hypothetical protein [Armatimonadota bacterium]
MSEKKKAKVIDIRPQGQKPKKETLKSLLINVNKKIPDMFAVKKDKIGICLYGKQQEKENTPITFKRFKTLKEGTNLELFAYVQGLANTYDIELAAYQIKQKAEAMVMGSVGSMNSGEKPEDKH